MILLFGTKTRQKQLCTVWDAIRCGRCGNMVQRSIRWSQIWFTLFFIPVFPIGKKRYFQICPVCGAQYEITKQEAEDFASRYRP